MARELTVSKMAQNMWAIGKIVRWMVKAKWPGKMVIHITVNGKQMKCTEKVFTHGHILIEFMRVCSIMVSSMVMVFRHGVMEPSSQESGNQDILKVTWLSKMLINKEDKAHGLMVKERIIQMENEKMWMRYFRWHHI